MWMKLSAFSEKQKRCCKPCSVLPEHSVSLNQLSLRKNRKLNENYVFGSLTSQTYFEWTGGASGEKYSSLPPRKSPRESTTLDVMVMRRDDDVVKTSVSTHPTSERHHQVPPQKS